MAKATGFTLLNRVARLLEERGVIPNANTVERIVIDLSGQYVPKVYITMFGDETLVEVVGMLTADPTAVDIKISPTAVGNSS